MPLFNGNGFEREDPLVWVYYRALNERRAAMRDGDWKVLAKVNGPKVKAITKDNAEAVKKASLSDFQFFKVTEDINESNELSKAHPEETTELKKRFIEHYEKLVEDSPVW